MPAFGLAALAACAPAREAGVADPNVFRASATGLAVASARDASAVAACFETRAVLLAMSAFRPGADGGVTYRLRGFGRTLEEIRFAPQPGGGPVAQVAIVPNLDTRWTDGFERDRGAEPRASRWRRRTGHDERWSGVAVAAVGAAPAYEDADSYRIFPVPAGRLQRGRRYLALQGLTVIGNVAPLESVEFGPVATLTFGRNKTSTATRSRRCRRSKTLSRSGSSRPAAGAGSARRRARRGFRPTPCRTSATSVAAGPAR